MTRHSVFGAAPYPVTLVEGTESPSIIVANGFYTFTTGVTGWACNGARIYIPAGMDLPSTTIGLWEYAGSGTGPDLSQAPVRSALLLDPVEGWNEVTWAPLTVVSGTPFWIGYDTGDGSFLASGGLSAGFITSWDQSPIVLGEENIVGLGNRSYFRIGTNPQESGGGFGYGVDPLILDLFGADIYVSDIFDRAGSSTLGRADTGQTWQYAPGGTDWGTAGDGTARKGGSPNNVYILAGIDDDHETILSTLLTDYTSGNQLFGPLTRYLDEDNFILWERVLVPGSEDAVKLYVRTNNVWNERGVWGGGPGATGLNPNDPIELSVQQIGLDLFCYVNGVERVTYTLTSPEDAALGASAGIRNEGVLTAWFDAFSVSRVSSEPVPSGAAETVVLDLSVAAAGSAPPATIPTGAATTVLLDLAVSAAGSAPDPGVPNGIAETVVLSLAVAAQGSAPPASIPVGAATTVQIGLSVSASGRTPGGEYTDGQVLAEILDLANSITILEDDDVDGSNHPPIYEYHTKVGNTDTFRILASDDLDAASSVKLVVGRKQESPTEVDAVVAGRIATVTITPAETAVAGLRTMELDVMWPGSGGRTRYPGRGVLLLYVNE